MKSKKNREIIQHVLNQCIVLYDDYTAKMISERAVPVSEDQWCEALALLKRAPAGRRRRAERRGRPAPRESMRARHHQGSGRH